MAILLKDIWHSAVIEFGFVSSCIFKISRVKVSVVMGYSPSKENGEESDRSSYNKDRIM